MSVLGKVVDVQKKLEKMMSDGAVLDQNRALDHLKTLKDVPMNLDILSNTRIGGPINKIRKASGDKEVIGLAKTVIRKWQKYPPENDGNEPPTNSNPSPTPVQKRPVDPDGERSNASGDNKKPKIEKKVTTKSSAPTPKGPDSCPPPSTTTNDFRLTCRELLISSIKGDGKYPDGSHNPEMLAERLEEEIFKEFKNTDMKYKKRIYSLGVKLSDPKNPNLRINFLQGSISSARLGKMTIQKMGSDKMNRMREKFVKEGVSDSQLAEVQGTKIDMPQCNKCKQRNCTCDKPLQLLPVTPNVLVCSKQDALSTQLEEFCQQEPIVLVSGLVTALKIDLRLFNSQTLVDTNPDQRIETRKQVLQQNDENWVGGIRSWVCKSKHSRSTIKKYAEYQAFTWQENGQGSVPNRKGNDGPEKIEFATNIDLVDEKWKRHVEELNKLPPFAKLVADGNMLSHVGHAIIGMNTIQVYMKVPGSRTSGHQENNNFCSININVGPGDCEWFAVPYEYWRKMQTLCEKNGIHYFLDSWWPNLDELRIENIPVHRFVQKPGDLVFVNAGVVHWVQALSWCNNIAWNVGPLTAHQHKIAMTRYGWNKSQGYKSLVPMVSLSWSLAKTIPTLNPALFELIKRVLTQSLTDCKEMVASAKAKIPSVKFHKKGENESWVYCESCDKEVFYVSFVLDTGKRNVPYCLNCAETRDQNLNKFLCFLDHPMDELESVYENFILKEKVCPA